MGVKGRGRPLGVTQCTRGGLVKNIPLGVEGKGRPKQAKESPLGVEAGPLGVDGYDF